MELIVLYHPHLTLTEDGGAKNVTQRQCLGAFSATCRGAASLLETVGDLPSGL